MDTKHLEYFRIVYEEKSIHAAAKKLFISPQGLGRILQNMEAEFGTVFFTRTKNGVFPTESGTLFYKQCIKTGQEFQALRFRMEQLCRQDHTLRIGFATGTLQLFPLEVLFRFIEEHPKIRVSWCEYHNQTLINKLLNSEVDYGFVVGRTHQDQLAQSLRCVCPVVLLVYEGHPLYHEKYITLEMLKDEKLLLMNEAFQIYHDFTAACRIQGFEPKVVAKTMDGAALYRMCMKKFGLAVSPRFPDQYFPNVKAVPFTGDYNWEIYGSFPRGQRDPEIIRIFDAWLEKKLPLPCQ